ncbi:MAG: alpha/beta fold hydrolase, partial [Verrucomicrobiota bacterium]
MVSGFLVTGLAVVVLVGSRLVAPQPGMVGNPPEGFQEVSFLSTSGSRLQGWWSAEAEAKGSILLLHGIRSDRRSMMGRARFLREEGYNTLAIDLQAHGESEGQQITFGYLESRDVGAALRFLKEQDEDLPVAVIGTSLGGAAALLSSFGDSWVSAYVVEAAFSELETATRNRVEERIGMALGKVVTPLLIGQLPIRIGLRPRSLRPISRVKEKEGAIFVINGSDDQRTTADEAQLFYDQA